MEFHADVLAFLPQAILRTEFPMGGATVEFTGPLLAHVLAAAGAASETVTIQAMDRYAVEAQLSDLIKKDALLALARNGEPLGIGGFGLTEIVFPRAERAGMTDDWWIWQVYHIKVERPPRARAFPRAGPISARG